MKKPHAWLAQAFMRCLTDDAGNLSAATEGRNRLLTHNLQVLALSHHLRVHVLT